MSKQMRETMKLRRGLVAVGHRQLGLLEESVILQATEKRRLSAHRIDWDHHAARLEALTLRMAVALEGANLPFWRRWRTARSAP